MIRVAREIIGYTMTFFGQTQVEKKIVSLSHLKEEVRKIIGSSRAIVQQGLDLVTHNGAIVDLRPLVQKNGQGEWQVTAIPCGWASGGPILPAPGPVPRCMISPTFSR